MKIELSKFCSEIGKNPLMVQGAGGNASYKSESNIWIKASGTKLKDAKKKEIFIQLNLGSLNTNDVNAILKYCNQASLNNDPKPSIELPLHILMKQKIVIHLHEVEALSYLVKSDGIERLKKIFRQKNNFGFINYFTPGAPLAIGISKLINANKDIDVIFMMNHGIIIAGNSIEDINTKLEYILSSIRVTKLLKTNNNPEHSKYDLDQLQLYGYKQIDTKILNELATNSFLYSCVKSNWSLYPDHVVFLGANPNTYSSINDLISFLDSGEKPKELVFIENI